MKSVICNVWVYKETIAQMKKGGDTHTHTYTHTGKERGGGYKGSSGSIVNNHNQYRSLFHYQS